MDSKGKGDMMLRRIAWVIFLLMVSVSLADAQQPKIQITSPHDKAQVPERPLVEGTIAVPLAKVWVVARPVDGSAYWVQPRATVSVTDLTWNAKIYIWRPGSLYVGKQFEIMAVANPRGPVKEGDVLSGWPEAQWKSEVIKVTRK